MLETECYVMSTYDPIFPQRWSEKYVYVLIYARCDSAVQAVQHALSNVHLFAQHRVINQ